MLNGRLSLSMVTLLLLSTSCSQTSEFNDVTVSRLLGSIDSLRVEGRYEEAIVMADRLELLTAKSGNRPWHAGEARRHKSTLSLVLALPPASRREMARADSLTPVIRKMLDVDENYIAAGDCASRQLEIRSRHLGHDHPDVAAVLDVLGEIAHRAGELANAGPYFERALAIRRDTLGANHPQVAETLHHWGRLHKDLAGRLVGKGKIEMNQAESDYLEALSILESTYPKDDLALAPLLQSLGSFCRASIRVDEGESYYQRALRINRLHTGQRSVAVAENLLWLGFCQLCAGKLEAADGSLTEARDIFAARGMGLSHRMGDTIWFMGIAAWMRDDSASAIDFWRESFRCRTNSVADHPQGFGQSHLRGLVGEWIDALLCDGRDEEAWEEVCRGSAPVAQSLMDLSVARRSWKDDSDTIDSLRAEVLAFRRRSTALAASDVVPAVGLAGQTRSHIIRASMDSIRVRLARVDADRMLLEQDLMSRIPEVPASSLTLERIQSHLRADQAMVGWVLGRWGFLGGFQKRSIWAFVLRHEGPVQWVHVGTRKNEECSTWVMKPRSFEKTMLRTSQWPNRVPADPRLNGLGHELWTEVFSPLMPHLNGIRDLVVIEGRSRPAPFWPFGVLPECLEDSQGVSMNERFAFSYTPSPAVFVHLAESAPAQDRDDPRSIVAVADPLGAPESSPMAQSAADLLRHAAGPPAASYVEPNLLRSAVSGDREALDRLPRLPHSRTEALKAAASFPKARVLLGPEANEETLATVLRSMPGLGVLHLATHALFDPVEPGRSALVLSNGRSRKQVRTATDSPEDGLITAEEVLLSWHLDADLVTLSGCQTNEGTQTRGGEDLGFAQAFLAAGARSLLMSRWKVDDLATSLLMGRFYENLTGSYEEPRAGLTGVPMSKTRSLQEAQIWLRNLKDEEGRAPFAHPVYWAGFVLIGSPD